MVAVLEAKVEAVSVLDPTVPLTGVDAARLHEPSLNRLMLSAASDKLTVSCGVRLFPGEVGEIDVNVTVGLVVSMTMVLFPPKLPAAPGDAKVNVALLPRESRIVPLFNARDDELT